MFPGRVGDAAIVAAGLPGLCEQMRAAGITTPRRVAAFLTTLAHESALMYNRRQTDQSRRYYGRGLIQLTGRSTDPDAQGNVMNYTEAGEFFGINLVATPDLALSIHWSPRIAAWYWTEVRPLCNQYADKLQIGKVCGAIGYPVGDGTEDLRRKASFERALKYLTGSVPDGITATR